jgi:hypothetical protein
MTQFEFDAVMIEMESRPDYAEFDTGLLGMRLQLELFRSWDAIPDSTRAVIACVAAELKRQSYREIQAELDARVRANRRRLDS